MKEKFKVQIQLAQLKQQDRTLGTQILKLEKEIDKLERKVNGTIEGETGGSVNPKNS